MMFPKAITWKDILENLDIVHHGEPVPIQKTTAEDLSQAVSRINDPARAALAKLWDWPGQGMILRSSEKNARRLSGSAIRGSVLAPGEPIFSCRLRM